MLQQSREEDEQNYDDYLNEQFENEEQDEDNPYSEVYVWGGIYRSKADYLQMIQMDNQVYVICSKRN